MGFAAKLAYRLYLLTMHWELQLWMRMRARLVDIMLGRRHVALFVFPDVFFEDVSGLTLGDHVSINRASNLSAGGGLTIGDHVAIGHGTSIMTTNHGFSDPAVPIKYQPVSRAAVTIGNNVWIGAKVTVLAGASISDGCVLAAGAVVTKSVDTPDSVVGGVPARRLRGRFDDDRRG